MVIVTVRTPRLPTEDPDKVRTAVTAFWPDMKCRDDGRQTVGEGNDLDAFRNRVWEQKIIDTVRTALLDGVEPRGVRFRLSKQAALSNKVSIPADRHALGDLDIKLTLQDGDPWDDAEALCWWLCPATEDGKIVGPTD